jgi:hypothetical protein
MSRATLLFLALTSGCASSDSSVVARCTVNCTTIAPEVGDAGDTVVVTGGPLTSAWDTSITVGGVRSVVLDVERSDDCDTCDECRDDNDCSECGDCDACDLQCEQECVETASFEVPTGLEPGVVDVVLFNVHGQSAPISFEIAGAADTGAGDTAQTDSGDAETGAAETGAADTAAR